MGLFIVSALAAIRRIRVIVFMHALPDGKSNERSNEMNVKADEYCHCRWLLYASQRIFVSVGGAGVDSHRCEYNFCSGALLTRTRTDGLTATVGRRTPISVKRINNPCKLSLCDFAEAFPIRLFGWVLDTRRNRIILAVTCRVPIHFVLLQNDRRLFANGQNDDNDEILAGTKTSVKVIWDGLTWPKPPHCTPPIQQSSDEAHFYFRLRFCHSF